MDVNKRRTPQRYICDKCYRTYSRRSVLKRHYQNLHALVLHPDLAAPKKQKQTTFSFQDMIPLIMMTKRSQKEPQAPPSYKQVETIWKFGSDMADTFARFYQNALESYILFPKTLISGFSSYICTLCFSVETLTPIKDVGIDLTSEGRHRCPSSSEPIVSTPFLTKDQRLKLSQLGSQMFAVLESHIRMWIPGNKMIKANIITVTNEKDDSLVRKSIKEKYDVPNKYRLEEVEDFKRSPWVLRLLRDKKLEPTPDELEDFCSYCVGTYAIFRTPSDGFIHYYTAFLGPAESISA